MSLFPAYGDKSTTTESQVETEKKPIPTGDATGTWQSNNSFINITPAEPIVVDDSDDSCSNSSDDSSSGDTNNIPPSSSSRSFLPPPPLDFDGSDEFYVDKKGNPAHRTIDSLPRLSCPRYKRVMRHLRDPNSSHWWLGQQRKHHRKHRQVRLFEEAARTENEKMSDAAKEEMRNRIKELNRLVLTESEKLENWIELHELLNYNLERSNRLAVVEHQLELLEMGLNRHPANEKLLHLYVATASVAFPASTVASRIEKLLQRDPFGYTLWTALIMTTQGTMARCIVPDVLAIYKRSMRRMHFGNSAQQSLKSMRLHMQVDTDFIMLKLFHNCVLFMRQTSNNCHAFALMKLALELNIPGVNFDCLVANSSDEAALIDYEEVVLQSGMPMPEIWTRIERLRQAFNFLPYPQDIDESIEGLDSQRFVYNEDVCHYIYPLKSEVHKMHLLLLTLQLTKLPFVRTNCLAEELCARIEQIGDSEAIEMTLAGLGDRYTYALPLADDLNFNTSMLEFAKEMCISPTFMPHFIGHELYVQCICALLLKSSEAFPHPADKRKRHVFIILWFRFERIRLVLLRWMKKLTEQYVKDARRRIRQLLRHESNRTVTRFYTELAMFEFEAMAADNDDATFRIFTNMIVVAQDVDVTDVDFIHAHLVYAEMLIARQRSKEALHVLSCVALERNVTADIASIVPLQQQALEMNLQRLNGALEAERTAGGDLPLEDYFLPNRFLLLVKTRCLLLSLLGRSMEACGLLQWLLISMLTSKEEEERSSNKRIAFLREHLFELQLVVMQLQQAVNPMVGVLEMALTEFPRNLLFLQRWAMLSTLPWYKVRARLTKINAGILSVIHMILAARCRFQCGITTATTTAAGSGNNEELQHDSQQMEMVLRNRILSMFETFLPTNPYRSKSEVEQYETLRRNSLYWRCYLRSLSDRRTSFDVSKKCLLIALDECPWDKALYMDGAIYVPQELPQLQDVMTEKHIRIYAIPEELEILREG